MWGVGGSGDSISISTGNLKKPHEHPENKGQQWLIVKSSWDFPRPEGRWLWGWETGLLANYILSVWRQKIHTYIQGSSSPSSTSFGGQKTLFWVPLKTHHVEMAWSRAFFLPTSLRIPAVSREGLQPRGLMDGMQTVPACAGMCLRYAPEMETRRMWGSLSADGTSPRSPLGPSTVSLRLLLPLPKAGLLPAGLVWPWLTAPVSPQRAFRQ